MTALLDIDQRDLLSQIRCPDWISHGAEDRVIPKDIAEEMHELLPSISAGIIALYQPQTTFSCQPSAVAPRFLKITILLQRH